VWARGGTQRVEASRQRAEGSRLHQHVAERGRLDRAGDDRHAACVGGQLAQQLVARSTTDDVDHVDVAVGQPLGVAHRAAVRQGEAVDDAAPGSRNDGNSVGAIPSHVMRSVAHVRVVTSSSCVVEALVISGPRSPVSQ